MNQANQRMSDEITEPDMRIPTSAVPPRRDKMRGTSTQASTSWGNWLARAMLLIVFIVGAFCSVTPWGRAATRGVMLLPALVAASQLGPIVASGEPIRHTSLTIASQGGDVSLDVWEPTAAAAPIPGAREGILVIPGVGDERQEPQLVNLMESLARSGLVAMAMTTPALIAYQLSPVDSDAVVRAYQKLAAWPTVGAGRVGILGFSAGGALASLAAVDPRIQSSLTFLTFFGGIFDAENVLRDFGRRALLVDGKPQPWQPNIVPLTVLANTLATTLPGTDAAAVSQAFDFNNGPTPTPLSPSAIASLSPPGQAAYHLLAGDAPADVDANLAALSPQMHTLLRALSPSSVVGQIHAPIYLLHDRNDEYVPFTESRDFAAALTRLGHSHDFVEFSIFQHTEVRSTLDFGALVRDGSRLYLEIYRLLAPSA